MPDPIGALQNLARQGTGNNQMMGMAGPGPNQQGMVPQAPSNTAANCKQKYFIKFYHSIFPLLHFSLFLHTRPRP